MKTETHPKYDKTTVTCSCGNVFDTSSTLFPKIDVEICYNCHPFYTGTQKLIDTAGRVEKFKQRSEKAEVMKANKKPKAAKKPKVES